MEEINSESFDERIRTELAELLPAALASAPYMAWRSHDPKAAGEDALQTGLVRLLAMSDELQRAFLERTPDKKIGYLLGMTRINAMQAERHTWRFDALTEAARDATAPDPAEEVERERFIVLLREMAREAMTEKQRSVFQLWLEEMPHEEIAEVLGISVEVSRQRLYDGLARAAKAAQKQGMS